jgi:RNA polymerase sigma-70 factor (ECF subfamily)
MAEETEGMAALLERARNGSDRAAQEFVRRFGPALLRVVRRKLDKRLRSKFDSMDFVQAAWASFFAIPRDEFQFKGSKPLAWYLIQVARNKVTEAVRQRLELEKFDVKREKPLHYLETERTTALGREPNPSEIAIAREEWAKLKQDQPSHYQEILESRGAGYTVKEIADHLHMDERSVRRVMERFRRRMKE